MSTTAVLLLVALFSPLVAFALTWTLSRAIRESSTLRGARRLAFIVVVAIQLFVLGFILQTEGFGLRALGTALGGSLLAWTAWSQLRRATPPPPGGRANATTTLPAP